jgi:hypothetical protein
MLTESAQPCTFLHESSERSCDPDRRRAGARSRRPRPDVALSVPRWARIDRKVELARRRLDALGAGAGDRRRGLLRIAVLRADEVLIDGILASFIGKREPGSGQRGRKGSKLRSPGA